LSKRIFTAAGLSFSRAFVQHLVDAALAIAADRSDDMRTVRQRERNLKHWRRSWKVRLILEQNPSWEDLYDRL
jgi:predicted GIY-YIG superfamily endonuclease